MLRVNFLRAVSMLANAAFFPALLAVANFRHAPETLALLKEVIFLLPLVPILGLCAQTRIFSSAPYSGRGEHGAWIIAAFAISWIASIGYLVAKAPLYVLAILLLKAAADIGQASSLQNNSLVTKAIRGITLVCAILWILLSSSGWGAAVAVLIASGFLIETLMNSKAIFLQKAKLFDSRHFKFLNSILAFMAISIGPYYVHKRFSLDSSSLLPFSLVMAATGVAAQTIFHSFRRNVEELIEKAPRRFFALLIPCALCVGITTTAFSVVVSGGWHIPATVLVLLVIFSAREFAQNVVGQYLMLTAHIRFLGITSLYAVLVYSMIEVSGKWVSVESVILVYIVAASLTVDLYFYRGLRQRLRNPVNENGCSEVA